MVVKRGDMFGSWDVDFMHTLQELKGAPKVTAKGLEIILKVSRHYSFIHKYLYIFFSKLFK